MKFNFFGEVELLQHQLGSASSLPPVADPVLDRRFQLRQRDPIVVLGHHKYRIVAEAVVAPRVEADTAFARPVHSLHVAIGR